jgi:hypothetical protein
MPSLVMRWLCPATPMTWHARMHARPGVAHASRSACSEHIGLQFKDDCSMNATTECVCLKCSHLAMSNIYTNAFVYGLVSVQLDNAQSDCAQQVAKGV